MSRGQSDCFVQAMSGLIDLFVIAHIFHEIKFYYLDFDFLLFPYLSYYVFHYFIDLH